MSDTKTMWQYPNIKTIADISTFWAEHKPNSLALKNGKEFINYLELENNANQIANSIVAAGIEAGSFIGYVGRNSIEFFEIWLGACKAGCAIAPLNWRCATPELLSMVNDAKIPLIFADKQQSSAQMLAVKQGAATTFELVSFDLETRATNWLNGWAASASHTRPAIQVKATDAALLVYTSGTTGLPKGVRYDHQAFNYSFLCMSLDDEMVWRSDDIGLMAVPNFHLGGCWVLLPALYQGACIRTVPAFDPDLVLAAIEEDKCTIVPVVPTALQMMVDSDTAKHTDFTSLTRVIYFGSPISADLMKRSVEVLGCRLNQLYGTTETWFVSLLGHDQHLGENPQRLNSCGKPLPLISVQVCDASGKPQPVGDVGELCVRTPTINRGYLNKPEATAEAFRDGWYRTGDLARLDEEGFIFLVDRAKDMIVSGGENIYSVEVERALNLHADVAMAAVIGVPDDKWGERVIAFVVLQQGAEDGGKHDCSDLAASDLVAPDLNVRLISHCRHYLAGYKVPKDIIIKSALPLNPTGKIQKNILRQAYWPAGKRNI